MPCFLVSRWCNYTMHVGLSTTYRGFYNETSKSHSGSVNSFFFFNRADWKPMFSEDIPVSTHNVSFFVLFKLTKYFFTLSFNLKKTRHYRFWTKHKPDVGTRLLCGALHRGSTVGFEIHKAFCGFLASFFRSRCRIFVPIQSRFRQSIDPFPWGSLKQ